MFYYLPRIIVGGLTIFIVGLITYSAYKDNKKREENNNNYLKNLTDEELKDLYDDAQKAKYLYKPETFDYLFNKQLENEYNKRIKKE